MTAQSDLEVVDEAGDAPETIAKLRLHAPDVLVMDLALLKKGGQPSAFGIRQAAGDLATLILTDEDGPEQLGLAIAAGARGYMLKNSSPAELAAGIRQIAASEEQEPRGLSKIIPDLQALASSNTTVTPLTSREQEVMRLLAEGRTVREVASELSLSTKTIEAHKLNLMRKLDIHNRASLIQYAAQHGLIAPQATA